MELEFHQLELRYERLRVIRQEQERRLLASLAEVGQQVPTVVVKDPAAGRFVVIDGYKPIIPHLLCKSVNESTSGVLSKLLNHESGNEPITHKNIHRRDAETQRKIRFFSASPR